MRELAEELREYTAMKYAGDCKCGKCQLVPRELVERIYHTLNGSAGHAQCSREVVIEECAALCDGLRRRDYSGENEDWIAGTSDCATAIRALSDTSTDRSSK